MLWTVENGGLRCRRLKKKAQRAVRELNSTSAYPWKIEDSKLSLALAEKHIKKNINWINYSHKTQSIHLIFKKSNHLCTLYEINLSQSQITLSTKNFIFMVSAIFPIKLILNWAFSISDRAKWNKMKQQTAHKKACNLANDFLKRLSKSST